MTARRILQARALVFFTLVALWCMGEGTCVAAALHDPEPNLRHPAVIGSAVMTVAWMLLAWGAMLAEASRLARVAWTLGFAAVLVHFALAIGFAHGWSHAATVEYIRQVGGYGEGIIVNYLFALVWGADVLWWWVNPSGREARAPWIGWAVHGFLAFVVVNATVVFGPPERRWWYAFAIVTLIGVRPVWRWMFAASR